MIGNVVVLFFMWPAKSHSVAKILLAISETSYMKIIWIPTHCVKSVRIRSFFGSYFPAFGMKTERYGVSLRIQSEWRKTRTRKSPNSDTFHIVTNLKFGKILQNVNLIHVKFKVSGSSRKAFLKFFFPDGKQQF